MKYVLTIALLAIVAGVPGTGCSSQVERTPNDGSETLAQPLMASPTTYTCLWYTSTPQAAVATSSSDGFIGSDYEDACVMCLDVEGPAGYNRVTPLCYGGRLKITCHDCASNKPFTGDTNQDSGGCANVAGAFIDLGPCPAH